MVCTLVHAIIRSGWVKVGDKGGGKVEGGDERIVACTCLRPLLDDVCDVFKGDIASDHAAGPGISPIYRLSCVTNLRAAALGRRIRTL